MEMVIFFKKYNIILGHCMTYYPQGNGLDESSNKRSVAIIKKVLNENKKNLGICICNTPCGKIR
jgi:hypothetical protein